MVTKKALAQWEIDSLLGNLSSTVGSDGPSAAGSRQVKLYDFRRPDKFAKDHLRALQIMHESFARQFGSALASYLRTAVNVHLSTIEQVLYDDYLNQLPNPTLISIIGMSPLPGRLTLEMGLDLAFLMIDRLLGGTGRSGRTSRDLTEIELALIRSLFKCAQQAIRDCWANVVALAPAVEDIVVNPQIVQAALNGEAAAMMIFEVKLFDSAGTISLCLPHSTVEPVLQRFSAQVLLGNASHRSVDRFDFAGRLRQVSLPLAVELGTAQVSVRDLAGLSVGDVLRLTTAPSDELPLLVDGQPKFKCVPGVMNRSMAVQITSVIDEEEKSPHA